MAKIKKTKLPNTNPLNTGDELRCSEMVSNSCSTCDTRPVTRVTKPVMCHEWGKDRTVITTNGVNGVITTNGVITINGVITTNDVITTNGVITTTCVITINNGPQSSTQKPENWAKLYPVKTCDEPRWWDELRWWDEPRWCDELRWPGKDNQFFYNILTYICYEMHVLDNLILKYTVNP